MTSYLVTGVLNGAAYGLLAVGFVLIYKGTRIFNLAHGEIGGAGLYLAWVLVDVMPVPLAALVGVAGAALLAAAVERLLVRRLIDRSPLAGVASTLGVALTIAYSEVHLFDANVKTLPSPVGSFGVTVAGVRVTAPRIAILVAAAATVVGITLLLRRTRAGLAMRAATSDPVLARVSAVRVDLSRSASWAIGGALAGVAAILLAPVTTFHPLSTTLVLVPALAAALLGGLTSIPGAMVGGLAIGVLESLVVWTSSQPGAVDLAILVVILATLLMRPEGLLGASRA